MKHSNQTRLFSNCYYIQYPCVLDMVDVINMNVPLCEDIVYTQSQPNQITWVTINSKLTQNYETKRRKAQHIYVPNNPLKTKRRLLYLKTQPRTAL